MKMRTDRVLEEEIFPFLSEAWGRAIRSADEKQAGEINEIRLRVGQPICLRYRLREVTVPTDTLITARQIEDIVSSLCHHSRYAMESELQSGYITIRGGHRVGMAGQAVIANGRIKLLKHIHSLAIRVARSADGCAKALLPHIWRDGKVHSILLAAPPYSGKTTILRDLVRLLSDGDEKNGRRGLTVGVADERSEIAGAYQGVPMLSVGSRTDVIDGAPKASSMLMLIRAMSPDVIAADELGRREDITAIEEAVHAGVAVIATIHGRSWQDITARMNRTEREVLELFDCVAFLDNRPTMGTVRSIVHCEREGGLL